MNVSLDGYVETRDHGLEWARVDDELHRWFNEHERKADAFLYGRRLYETMSAYWPRAEADPAATPTMLEYARIWNPKPKIVFSSTLGNVDHNSRLASGDVADELARIRAEFPGELHVAGATLAAQFIGGGTPYLPATAPPLDLELVDTRRFASGVMYLGYGVRR
jgi:dihydrofolate reductase